MFFLPEWLVSQNRNLAVCWVVSTRGIKNLKIQQQIKSVNVADLCDAIKNFMESTSLRPAERMSLRLSVTLIRGACIILQKQTILIYSQVENLHKALFLPRTLQADRLESRESSPRRVAPKRKRRPPVRHPPQNNLTASENDAAQLLLNTLVIPEEELSSSQVQSRIEDITIVDVPAVAQRLEFDDEGRFDEVVLDERQPELPFKVLPQQIVPSAEILPVEKVLPVLEVLETATVVKDLPSQVIAPIVEDLPIQEATITSGSEEVIPQPAVVSVEVQRAPKRRRPIQDAADQLSEQRKANRKNFLKIKRKDLKEMQETRNRLKIRHVIGKTIRPDENVITNDIKDLLIDKPSVPQVVTSTPIIEVTPPQQMRDARAQDDAESLLQQTLIAPPSPHELTTPRISLIEDIMPTIATPRQHEILPRTETPIRMAEISMGIEEAAIDVGGAPIEIEISRRIQRDNIKERQKELISKMLEKPKEAQFLIEELVDAPVTKFKMACCFGDLLALSKANYVLLSTIEGGTEIGSIKRGPKLMN